MSGGASAGHPHPKELLVIRDDGSSAAYPVFRTVELAAHDGSEWGDLDTDAQLMYYARARLSVP